MSDALKCDGPDCVMVGVFPYLGWWRLENTAALTLVGSPERADFCSWQCLGAFVFANSGEAATIQDRIDRLKE